MNGKKCNLGEYVEFQEVSPSRMHTDSGVRAVQNQCKERCNDLFEEGRGFDLIQIIRPANPTRLRRNISRQLRPVGKVLLYAGGAVGVLSLIGWTLYQLALIVRDGFVALWAWMIESGFILYTAIGAGSLLFFYVAYSLRTAVKNAPGFDDMEPPKSKTTHKTSGGHVINHNHYYNS